MRLYTPSFTWFNTDCYYIDAVVPTWLMGFMCQVNIWVIQQLTSLYIIITILTKQGYTFSTSISCRCYYLTCILLRSALTVRIVFLFTSGRPVLLTPY